MADIIHYAEISYGSVVTLWDFPSDQDLAATLPGGLVAALVEIPAKLQGQVEPGWLYDPQTGFTSNAPPPPTKAELTAQAAVRRYEHEIAGITWQGQLIDTSIESQNRISNALMYVEAAGVEMVDFKPDGGWTVDSQPLPVGYLRAIAIAIGAHVQATFSAEKLVAIDIIKGVITTAAEVDASPHWDAILEAQST